MLEITKMQRKFLRNKEIKYLGNIYGTHLHDSYGGAVFSKGGCAPAIHHSTSSIACVLVSRDEQNNCDRSDG